MTVLMNRRSFVAASGAAALASTLPTGAFALDNAQARALVDALVGEINAVIDSGKAEKSHVWRV